METILLIIKRCVLSGGPIREEFMSPHSDQLRCNYVDALAASINQIREGLGVAEQKSGVS